MVLTAPTVRIPAGIPVSPDLLHSGFITYKSIQSSRTDYTAYLRIWLVPAFGAGCGGIQVGSGAGGSYGRIVVMLTDDDCGNSITNTIEDAAVFVEQFLNESGIFDQAITPKDFTIIEHYIRSGIGDLRRSCYGDFKLVTFAGYNPSGIPQTPIWDVISDDEVTELLGTDTWKPEKFIYKNEHDFATTAYYDERADVVVATASCDDQLMDVLSKISDEGIQVDIQKVSGQTIKRYIGIGKQDPDIHPLALPYTIYSGQSTGKRPTYLPFIDIYRIIHKGKILWEVHA